MTNEEKAKAYAKKELVRTISRHAHPLDELAPYFDSKDIQQAYLAGATEALASQWVSVEERMPEIGELVMAVHIGFVTATYDGKDWYDANDHLIRPTHWLPIPPLKGGDA